MTGCNLVKFIPSKTKSWVRHWRPPTGLHLVLIHQLNRKRRYAARHALLQPSNDGTKEASSVYSMPRSIGLYSSAFGSHDPDPTSEISRCNWYIARYDSGLRYICTRLYCAITGTRCIARYRGIAIRLPLQSVQPLCCMTELRFYIVPTQLEDVLPIQFSWLSTKETKPNTTKASNYKNTMAKTKSNLSLKKN